MASNTGYFSDYNLGVGLRFGQQVTPSLPADAVSWRITKVMLMLGPQGGTSSMVEANVLADAGGTPGTLIDQVSFPESVLMSGFWYQCNFTKVSGLSPKEPVHIEVAAQSGKGSAGQVRVGQNLSATGGYWNVDGSFVADSGYDMYIWLYGKVSVPDPDFIPPSTKTCQSIGILLNTSKSDANAVQTRALTWNEPTMP